MMWNCIYVIMYDEEKFHICMMMWNCIYVWWCEIVWWYVWSCEIVYMYDDMELYDDDSYSMDLKYTQTSIIV